MVAISETARVGTNKMREATQQSSIQPKATDAATAHTTIATRAAQGTTTARGPSLAETAVSGRPIEAGLALRTLDERTGSRSATQSFVAQNALYRGTFAQNFTTTNFARAQGVLPTKTPDDDSKKPEFDSPIKINFGPDGWSVEGTIKTPPGGGPVSGENKTEVETGPDGTKITNETTVKIEEDGKVVDAKIEVKNKTVTETKDNGDGTTTYKVEADTSVTVGGSVDAKKVKVEGSLVGGSRAEYSVTVPNGVDPKSIDILNPQSWPEGTRVQIKSEDYQGSSLEVLIKGIGVGGDYESRTGTSVVIEKQVDNKVGIATGPTDGFTSSGKLKIDLGAGFSFEAGAEHKLDSSAFSSFTVDLNTAEGRAAYRESVFNGNPPTANGNGVSDYKQIYTNEYAYKNGIKIKTPVGELNLEGHKENSSGTTTVYPDGRVEVSGTYDSDGDGKVDMTRTASSTDGGKTWSEPVYKYSLPIRNETDLSYAKGFTGNENLKVGDTLEITVTEKQMEEMRENDQSFHPQVEEDSDLRKMNNTRFACFLVRWSGDNTAGTLIKMMEAYTGPKLDDPYGGPRRDIEPGEVLPGTVKVIEATPPTPPSGDGSSGSGGSTGNGYSGGGGGGGGGGGW